MSSRFIYVACPWTPIGGGMFKVADYLIQSQAQPTPADAASLRPLDTRGEGSPASSLGVLAGALGKLWRGRRSGELAGVHVNMAERLSLVRKSVVVVFARAIGLPVVLHLHAAQLHHFFVRLPALARAPIRWTFGRATVCVVLGQQSRRFVVDDLHVPDERVRTLVNGVPRAPASDAARAAVLAELGAKGTRTSLLFLGNLSERKGVSDLLHALAQSPLAKAGRIEAIFAGGGDVAAYRAKVETLGLTGCAHFVGWADQSKAAALMERVDALALPSYDEGLPLVILEAMGKGLPVICTPVGEIGNTFVDGRDAVFVPPGDVAALSAAIDRVLGDAELRARLSARSLELFAGRFSLERFFEQLAEIHREHFGIAARYGGLK